ncbi:amino acid adenylation domain-containing protein [Terasakiella sp.]|uniref:amino acid adenylation domain-containing protein n=1 Tax=Terasakiella sp. TaxID=2034861 RepID=UPI003AA8DBF4
MENRYKELMANAMKTIGELRHELEQAKRDQNEPIAIVAMGCHFPGGADNPQKFWDLLCNGQNTACDIPAERWENSVFFDPDPTQKGKTYCKRASFLDGDIFGFDAPFFAISPREAQLMDPQQRLLLETAWQTIENAGLAARKIKQSRTGVFVGTMSYDFLQTTNTPDDVDVHSATGLALSAAAGRISHFFDLNGPSLTLDTACSSSLVAVHLACNAIRRGECDLALAGGVNVMTSPYMAVAECAANMLSPDGTCKTFDADADGYGRGEGCGFILLKRLSDAQRDNDKIIAVVQGSAVNHDGQSSALTVPNSSAQIAVMEAALNNATLDPTDISYVEAHGTGTPLGDPIEIEGLNRVYARTRNQDNPLIVASVKANIGHLEGAAGIAGLIKTALSLHHGIIPAHASFTTPNPHIDWDKLALNVPTQSQNWPANENKRIGAISSFGFSGTNAHIILGEVQKTEHIAKKAPFDAPHMLAISAKTKAAFVQQIEHYIDFLQNQPETALENICYSSNIARDHFEYRFACPVTSLKEAIEKLKPAKDMPIKVKLKTETPQTPDFTDLPQAYLEGANIDWDSLYQERDYTLVTLPPYPFQRSRYKLETKKNTHILGQRDGDTLVWINPNLFPAHNWLLDHKIGGQSVFPGVAYLEMACAAFHQLMPDARASIKQMDLKRPLLLDEKKAYTLKTEFSPHERGYRFIITAQVDSSSWTAYAEGVIVATTDHINITFPDLKEGPTCSGSSFYQTWQARGNDWQGAFQGIANYQRHDHTLIAKIQHPNLQTDGYFAHPAILDACGHLLADFAEQFDQQGRFVAQSIKGVVFHRPFIGKRFWSHATLTTQNDRHLIGSLYIFNDAKELLVSVEDCTFTFVDNEQSLHRLDDDLYHITWRDFDLSKASHKPDALWLLLNDEDDRADPYLVHLLETGEQAEKITRDQLLPRLEGEDSPVHLLDFSLLHADADRIAPLSTQIISTLTDIKDHAVDLWLMTQNAWTEAPHQAAFWGLGRTLAVEESHHWGGLIDLGTHPVPQTLCHLIDTVHKEDQFRLTENRVQVPRLTPADISPTAIDLDEDASYLITGGFGAIGRECAKMLARKGAKNIILIGRNVPSDLGEFEKKDINIIPVALDISNLEAFEHWYHDQAPKPIKGVIHAAGVATRAPACQLDFKAFAQQFSPKIRGLQALDQVLDDDELDFFIALSSASAVLNSPELGAYASANATMDAFMAQRRRHGKKGLSLAWGPWKEAGMAADHFDPATQLLHPVRSQDAIALMDRLLGSSQDYLAILPFGQRRAALGTMPICQELIASQETSKLNLADLDVQKISDFLCATLAPIFKLEAANFPQDEPLSLLGMDSLMALEIKNVVEERTNATLQIVDLMGGMNITELAQQLTNNQHINTTSGPAKQEQEKAFPLTPGQQSLWLIHEMDGETPAYNVAFALDLQGDIDFEKMMQDWQTIVARHPSLNTCLSVSGDEILQHVQADIPFEIDVQNVDDLQTALGEAYRQPFDLKTGPLFRAHLIRTIDQGTALLLVAHHIVCDGWSLWVLLDEFAQLNNGNVLPDLPICYQDYAQAQTAYLNSERATQDWKFWQDTLSGPLPVLTLPTDRPRPSVQSYNGATHTFVLDKDTTHALKHLSQQSGVSDYVTLLSLYSLLLHRYSQQDDILIGCPTTGRNKSDYDGVVGHFVNPVVMRQNLSHDLSWADFLQQTKTVVLSALTHQDYPFARLVEKLHPSREAGVTPIFQTDFTFQQPQKAKDLVAKLIEGGDHPLHWGTLDVLPHEINQQEGQFDISFEIIESNGQFHCSLKYSTDLFDATTMERMGKHFENLAHCALNDLSAPLSHMDMMDETERHQVLVGFNQTDAVYPSDSTVAHHFKQQVARTPEKIAVVSGTQRWTYQQLNEQANRIAHWLRQSGIQPNDFVAILDHRSADFLAAILGIMKAGAAYVPIDPEYPQERISYMLENAQAATVITRQEFEGMLADGVQALRLESTVLEGQSADDIDLVNRPTDRAYMIYTSGSTGQPKGAIVRHNGALNHIFAEFEAMSFHEDSVFLQSAPSSSDISIWQFLGPVLIGGTCVVADFHTVCTPKALYQLICDENVTVIELVPVVLDELIALIEETDTASTNKLEWGMVTGEAASVALVNRWLNVLPHVPLINAYGPSEAADDVCQYVLREKLPETIHNVPIGTPIGNMRMYVLDDVLNPVPIGLSGEICVSGIGVGEGYWQNPQKTEQAFVANPHSTDKHHQVLYRTGDTGRWLACGNLEYLGRFDDQVKIRGYRIELGEIEARLMAHPAVRQALVITFEDPQTGKNLAAYLRCENTQPDITHLRTFLGESLPPHMVPAAFVFVDNFPQLPNGKVDKKSLIAPQIKSSPPVRQAGQTATQQKLIALWKDLLGHDAIGVHDNFFELGGHSLLMARLHRRVQDRFARDFPLVTMFQYPTIASLAQFLNPQEVSEQTTQRVVKQDKMHNQDIAIIAMTCRFPGARTVEEYWNNLHNKVESVTFFDTDTLLKRGADGEQIHHPDYVPGCAVLDDLDQFDAPFFGFNAREAELMDPQQRLFLEGAWETLEQAGYAGDPVNRPVIGCFAGQGATTYLSHHVEPTLDEDGTAQLYQVEISNDKDYIATSAGYKLNLQGPCVSVQTACSTSLVAVHMACQSLQSGECDMALAGSISANVLHQAGYLYQDGMILSPDGHCRPFDETAKGTIPGSGMGIVLLKPLDKAINDNDIIHAVIKGSAINNDGALKAGYTAPSVDGQVGVIKKAYDNAGIDPQSIGYICAHGTGTPMGDPIEIAALSTAFGPGKPSTCAIGSVKANIGHTDTAAGVASLICAVMAMKHKTIPPQLHFNTLNPAMDLTQSPFFIPTKAQNWDNDGQPRRAGISSLGIGGTNAHVIVEEAPHISAPQQIDKTTHLLTLSAQTKQALAAQQKDLENYLNTHADINITDVAYTLNVGRKAFAHRCVLVHDSQEIVKTITGKAESEQRPLTFMFSGQGAQFADMGKDLYRQEPVFKDTFDETLGYFNTHLETDLHAIWGDKERINQTVYTQPLLFAFEYASAKLLESWGIHPDYLIGHSIGEYGAACLSCVFSLQDACLLVATRAKLMQSMPSGAMCALHVPSDQAQGYLTNGLDLAASNSSNLSVLSGPFDAIDDLEQKLEKDGISYRRLHTSHAFHSASMEALEHDFLMAFNQIKLNAPTRPFLSNLSGTWISDDQACNPVYWYQHLRQSVQFSDGLGVLLENNKAILLELGPGNTLATFAQQHNAKQADHLILACHQGVYGKQNGHDYLLHSLARLWTNGVNIDWTAFWHKKQARRIALPTYPFERKRYWIAPNQTKSHKKRPQGKLRNLDDWFNVSTWQRAPIKGPNLDDTFGPWLIFVDDLGFANQLGLQGITVRKGDAFSGNIDTGFTLNPVEVTDYNQLFDQLERNNLTPKGILHFWSFQGPAAQWQDNLETDLDHGFISLLHIAQNIGRRYNAESTVLKTILNQTQDINGEEALNPTTYSASALLKVIAQEFPGILCQCVDFATTQNITPRMVDQLRAEVLTCTSDPLVSYRGRYRWVQTFEPAPPTGNKPLKEGATLLITGGLGHLGFIFAKHLALNFKAKLALVTRKMTQDKLEKVTELKKLGAEVLAIPANVANLDEMQTAIAQTVEHFATLDGVIHTAGITDQDYPLEELTPDIYHQHLEPKIRGTLVLEQVLKDRELDFVCLFSSLSSVLGGIRFGPYAAVNAFMDSFCQLKNRDNQTPWLSICWDGWKGDDDPVLNLKARDENTILETEGLAAFDHLMQSTAWPDQSIISVTDLPTRIEKWITPSWSINKDKNETPDTLYERPDLETDYIGAATQIEQTIVVIWQNLLGLRDIGIDDNFFELGGHSLLGTQMITRLRQTFGGEMNITTLFENPTIRELAARQEAMQEEREEFLL